VRPPPEDEGFVPPSGEARPSWPRLEPGIAMLWARVTFEFGLRRSFTLLAESGGVRRRKPWIRAIFQRRADLRSRCGRDRAFRARSEVRAPASIAPGFLPAICSISSAHPAYLGLASAHLGRESRAGLGGVAWSDDTPFALTCCAMTSAPNA